MKKMPRREFLGLTGATIATALFGKEALRLLRTLSQKPMERKDSSKIRIDEIPIAAPLEIAVPKTNTEYVEMRPAKDWTDDTVLEVLQNAAQESLREGKEFVVELPEGEIIVRKKLEVVIPEGAKVILKGNAKGTRLSLAELLSDIPKDWGSFGQRNILFFKDLEGELAIEGIEFNGGSERAGKSGYVAPKSPWDSTLMIIGKGDGSTPDAEKIMNLAGKRKGTVSVKQCRFGKSESGGMVAQNLRKVEAANIHGRNLDGLVIVNWCDEVEGNNIRGKNFTSDGIYVINTEKAIFSGCHIETARQAYDFQGDGDVSLRQCHATDCAIAFLATSSEANKLPTKFAEFTGCNSIGCQAVYALGGVEQVNVVDSMSNLDGTWLARYTSRDFLHFDAIVDPEAASQYAPVIFFDVPGISKKSQNFSSVSIHLWPGYSTTNSFPKIPGVTYTKHI